jgi:hypothetical protein
MAGGVAHTVQCLLCQHLTLITNPSPTKKKIQSEY